MTFQEELKELFEKYEVEITARPVYDYQGSYIESIDIDYKENDQCLGISVCKNTIEAKDL